MLKGLNSRAGGTEARTARDGGCGGEGGGRGQLAQGVAGLSGYRGLDMLEDPQAQNRPVFFPLLSPLYHCLHEECYK